MQWKIHGERPVYENEWVNLWLTDIETPDGNRWEHHVVKLRHLAVAAVLNERREVLEETGWRPAPVKPLIYAEPANGITDSQHHVFRADGATYEGPPTEKNESDRIEWIPLADIRGMIDRREIVSSGSLVGLLYLLMDEAIR
ncbi:NUDIX domain-containing protein [Streptomyces sp. NPDC047024]|uniref:NUDIX domain-containing protein n=1 Tax=Streptomyces sp. NPDC047024 TaxID=3155476 RepID=UPI0034103B9C